jgi:hypothetical protein
LPQRQGSRGG